VYALAVAAAALGGWLVYSALEQHLADVTPPETVKAAVPPKSTSSSSAKPKGPWADARPIAHSKPDIGYVEAQLTCADCAHEPPWVRFRASFGLFSPMKAPVVLNDHFC
jgi:hypothetical protein